MLEAVASAEAVGSTSSRLLSGNSRQWEEIESEFACFAGTETALFFGSGYAANVGLLSSLLKPGDIVFSDALNHASLIDGIRLSGAEKIIYPHGDLEFLERVLHDHADSSGARIVVTESVFSMEGDIATIAPPAGIRKEVRPRIGDRRSACNRSVRPTRTRNRRRPWRRTRNARHRPHPR